MKKSKEKKKKSLLRCMLKVLLSVVALVLVVVVVYLAYMFISYGRIEDNIKLEAENVYAKSEKTVKVDEVYKLLSWNVGYGAYSDDYTFFMDGGVESWARKDELDRNMKGIISKIESVDADFVYLQEVDKNGTRTHHLDEVSMINDKLKLNTSFAVNFDSSFLFYPLTEPHGKNLSGMMTMSKFEMKDGIRHSLPIETGFRKFLDYDRAYTKLYVDVENGKKLVLLNLHLSAFTADGKIAIEQLQIIVDDMLKERAAGNYVIAAGDFNKDLTGNCNEIFNNTEVYVWAQPIPDGIIPDSIRLVDPTNYETLVPSCRNNNEPYQKGHTFIVTVDGFMVTDNVEIESYNIFDEGFKYSDHNPVELNFKLK